MGTRMLRRIRYGGGDRGDEGVATAAVVMTVAVLLAAGILIVGRIAQADDMFTRAQAGADAAALGTLAPLRDRAVSLALDGIDPSAAGYWSVGAPPESAAAEYAAQNRMKVTRTRLSGMRGDTAMVEVATKECQLKRKEELTAKERDDLRNKRDLCTDAQGKKGIGRFATAKAVAAMISPQCAFDFVNPLPGATGIGPISRLRCDNVTVYPGGDRARVTRLFKLRLVDHENPIAYDGRPDGLGGTAGGGGVVASECAKTGKRPADDLPFGGAVVAWALCWRGTAYAWGGGSYDGPTRGICCSPGGYDGRNYYGFDCSGLTMYAVYQASRGRIALGHFTGSQLHDPRGTAVPLDQLQAGDLLFFGPDPSHHVAIYYGDNQMVEAPQTGDVVKISPLRQPDYARRFG
ncbi:C40 family peptidase [Actinomadura violacea]|uniref:C40 family peptidase n=1 Tax=Actinomadura violacea TaxID=2819934 RepID=A0ABS3RQ36_9ACTN|nr:C40 family peptidase [Actinomadura violacea]MBO2458857.1 C40 family peptidase [Actinomadura violacea]